MTLDEAIKYAEEVAEEQEKLCKRYPNASGYTHWLEYAEEHRQLAEWLKELKWLREQTTWIPVSERLPEKNGQYLVTVKKGYMLLGLWCGIKDDWRNVIAWMPLPESYKVSPTGAESEE